MISQFLNQSAKFIRYTLDDDSEKTDRESWSLKARVEPTNRVVLNKEGEQVVSSAKIIINGQGKIPEQGDFYVVSEPPESSTGTGSSGTSTGTGAIENDDQKVLAVVKSVAYMRGGFGIPSHYELFV